MVGAVVGSSVGAGVSVGCVVGLGCGVAVGALVGVGVGQAFGSVPLIKNSFIAVVVATLVIASTGHVSSSIIEAGFRNDSSGLPLKKFSMSERQIGAAPREPATLSIGVASLFPTHTPITILGVYPTVNASL